MTTTTKPTPNLTAVGPEGYKLACMMVEWDEYHGGIYSKNNPSVAEFLILARTIIKKVESQ